MLGVWEEAGALASSSRYEALLGHPTWRERLVAGTRRLAGIGAGPAARGWRPAVPVLAGGAALAVAVTLLLPAPSAPLRVTAGAAARTAALPDGSAVVLGPDSTFTFETDGGQRLATLTGEAELDVAPDAARPFTVVAGDARVRVVGTRFMLTHRGACTQLLVHSGIVEIAAPGLAPRRVQAGEEAAAIDRGAPPGPCLDAASRQPLRWSYIDAPLSTILADIAPFYPQRIVLGSAEIGAERVTLAFEGEQIAHVIELLPAVLEVEIARADDGTIVIGR